jgi:hypothetical protein
MAEDTIRPEPRFLSREQLLTLYGRTAEKEPDALARTLAQTRLTTLERFPVDTIRDGFILQREKSL